MLTASTFTGILLMYTFVPINTTGVKFLISNPSKIPTAHRTSLAPILSTKKETYALHYKLIVIKCYNNCFYLFSNIEIPCLNLRKILFRRWLISR